MLYLIILAILCYVIYKFVKRNGESTDIVDILDDNWTPTENYLKQESTTTSTSIPVSQTSKIEPPQVVVHSSDVKVVVPEIKIQSKSKKTKTTSTRTRKKKSTVDENSTTTTSNIDTSPPNITESSRSHNYDSSYSSRAEACDNSGGYDSSSSSSDCGSSSSSSD